MSLFSPRISTKSLATLCRRWATALIAGIDIRSHVARDAEMARGSAARRVMESISQCVRRGQSLTDALAQTDDYFPQLFREMIEVGEQSGHLGEVFRQLALHYEQQIERRRTFQAAIVWPMIELSIAIVMVGVLIWFNDTVGHAVAEILGKNTKFDVLGIGLSGEKGLVIYTFLLATVAFLIYLTIRAARRGLMWTRLIQRIVMRAPILGTALRSLAVSHFAWSLHLTLNSGMDVRRAVRLSLRSSGSAYYTDHIETIDRQIAQGHSLDEAFRTAGCFNHDFLDIVQTGEHTGTLVEVLARCSQQFQEQAKLALTMLTRIAGALIWIFVAAIITTVIFRLAMVYYGMITDLANGKL
jgi:type II secretory pathway component PulF